MFGLLSSDLMQDAVLVRSSTTKPAQEREILLFPYLWQK
jgi:hypothetical protein